jgi:hypothetical protein
MRETATQNVPRGLVRSLTTRWELKNDDISNAGVSQQPLRPSMSTGVRPKTNIPQLHNSFFQEILGRVYGELEVAGFTLERERVGGPSQTSNIVSVQVLSADASRVHLIFKSLNSSSPKAKVRR